MRGDGVARRAFDPSQCGLEAVVLEQLDLAARVADDVMVMVASGPRRLVAGRPVTKLDLLEKPVAAELVERAIDAREPDCASSRAEAVEDLLRGEAARLAGEELDHRPARPALLRPRRERRVFPRGLHRCYGSTPMRIRMSLILVAAGAMLALAPGAGAKAPLQVVAAENVWGSIAAQIGGDRVQVTSIVANPATDPHDYEPTAVDARTLAEANLVIVNGIGYDAWAPKLLAANPVKGRITLTVGDVVGVKPGGNPHRWYSPANVVQVAAAIAAGYARLDPEDHAYFAQQAKKFETKGLAAYHAEIAGIRHRYAGVPVGASESIFAPLAQALGLKLLTPYSYLQAISEGTDPTARDTATVHAQIAKKQIKVWLFNSQNSTPDIQRLTNEAHAKHIPVTTITETLVPEHATFEAWQVAQLRALRAALAHATGR